MYVSPRVTGSPYLGCAPGRAPRSRGRTGSSRPPAVGWCGGFGRQHAPCRRLCKTPALSCRTRRSAAGAAPGGAREVLPLVPVCPLGWGAVGVFLLAHRPAASGIPEFNTRHVLKGSQERQEQPLKARSLSVHPPVFACADPTPLRTEFNRGTCCLSPSLGPPPAQAVTFSLGSAAGLHSPRNCAW